MENKRIDLNTFFEKYRLIGSSENINVEEVEKVVCRFCFKDENSTTFKKKAHACPELLGRNNFVIFDECDKCNEQASKYESHLSKFFMPYLSILGVRGKRKIPKFQSRTVHRNEATRTLLEFIEEGKVNLVLNKESIDDYIINKDEKSMSIRFRSPPLKPIYVYKSLVKIALSFLPSDKMAKYRLVFEWLMGQPVKIALSPSMFVSSMSRYKFRIPFVELYESRNIYEGDDFYPELSLIVGFGNVITQIFLPFSEAFSASLGARETIEVSSSAIYPFCRFETIEKESKYCTSNIKIYNMSSSESTIFDEVLHFKYEKGDFNI